MDESPYGTSTTYLQLKTGPDIRMDTRTELNTASKVIDENSGWVSISLFLCAFLICA